MTRKPCWSEWGSILMTLLSLCRRLVDHLSRALVYLAMGAVFAMVLLIVVDVVLRAFFARSTLVADEGGGYLLVMIAFLAMAETLKQGRHVRVNLIERKFPVTVRAWLSVVLPCIGLAALVIVVWRAIIMVQRSYVAHVKVPGVFMTPVYLPQLLIVIGFFVLALQCIVVISTAVTALRKKSGEEWAEAGREVRQR